MALFCSKSPAHRRASREQGVSFLSLSAVDDSFRSGDFVRRDHPAFIAIGILELSQETIMPYVDLSNSLHRGEVL